MPADSRPIVGVTQRLYFIAKGDGTIQLWINNVLKTTLSIVSNVTFNALFRNVDGSTNGKLKSLRVFNKDLSKSEIEGLDKFLSSIYPEHETTNIGSQAWVTSNHLGNVTSDGFVIPEVQGNDAASNPELVTNGNFESGLVGTLLNDVGGATVSYTLNTVNPISGTQDGRIQITSAGTSASRPIIFFGNLTAGKTYKISFDYKLNSGTALIPIITNGVINITIAKSLTGTGSYTIYIAMKASQQFGLYIDGRNTLDLQVDNFSHIIVTGKQIGRAHV